ncbi:hypothetical protein ABEV00_28405 [Paenibacillus thiaminolyticus]|uniref:hypothetical protein n=1 Tax=Paenibacillus thiaminolyticus TaxID=49283 RepID=UPI003D2D3293
MKVRRGVYVPGKLDAEYVELAERYGVSVPYLIVVAAKLVDRSKMIELLELTAGRVGEQG